MVRDNSTIFLFGTFFIGVAVLVLAWNGMFVPADPDALCPTNICRAYRVFSEFQTLLGAGLAIFAAWLAAQPVWRQLTKMNIQQDIMAREIIERRLNSIIANSRFLDTKVSAFLQDIWRGVYDWGEDPAEYDPAAVTPLWAFNMESTATR